MQLGRRGFLAAAAIAPAIAAAQDAKHYRACIIGDTALGGYGHSMHLVFAKRPDVEVVALADPDEAGRAKHAAECGAQRTYADYREMLDKEKPDIVVIGPRTTVRHKEYLLAAAECGAHGLIEKPLAVDLAEADEMLAAVRAKNLKWSIAFNMRMSPEIQYMKKYLEEEQPIGSILEIRGRGKEDHRAGGEDLVVLGPHLFDMMVFLLGKPSSCLADITWNGKPATPADVREATEPLGPIVGNRIHSLFGFDVGIAGHFSSMESRDGNAGPWGFAIYGTRGIVDVRIEAVSRITLIRDPSPGTSGASWEPLPGCPSVEMADPNIDRNQPIVDDLIAAIEEDRLPAVDIGCGLTALEMVQATFASYASGKRLPLPLEDRRHPLRDWS